MADSGELQMQVIPVRCLPDARSWSDKEDIYVVMCRSERLGKEEVRKMLGTRQVRGSEGEKMRFPRLDTAAFRFQDQSLCMPLL